MKVIKPGKEPCQVICCPYCGSKLLIESKDVTPIWGDYGTYYYDITSVSLICKWCKRKVTIDHKKLRACLYEAIRAPKEKSFLEKFMDELEKFCESLRF